MSFITTNYSNLEENNYSNEPLPKGEYEMVIYNPELKGTRTGREFINIPLVVRNDLKNVPSLAEQNGKFANRFVWSTVFTDRETGQYKAEHIQYILKAVGVPEGTRIEDINQFLEIINHKAVRAYVNQQEDNYNGKNTIKNSVAPWGLSETQYKELNHKFSPRNAKGEVKANVSTTTVQEDDLPF